MSAEADLPERHAINESPTQLRRGYPFRVAQSLEDAHAATEQTCANRHRNRDVVS